MSSTSTRIPYSWRIGLLLLAAVTFFAWWMAVRTDRVMRDDLLGRTRMLAQAVNLSHVRTLSGSAADLTNSCYREIKEQLAAIHSADPHCRFMYLMGRPANGTVNILVDSAPVGAKDYSPPGQVYDEASATLLRVFDTGTAAVEGPVPDRWGTWVSSLVPILDTQTGRVLAVMGMDVDARDWNRKIAARVALPVGLLLALSFIFVLLHRTDQNIRAQQVKLQASELQLQTILESTADGILAVDKEGNVIKANHRLVELWQIPKPLLEKGGHQELSKFFAGQLLDPQLALKQYQSIVDRNTSDVRVLHTKDGRFFESTTTPMILGGKVAGQMWVVHDITERHRIEESHTQLATAVEQSAETIVITDPQGTILYANPAFEKNTGYTCAEVIGQNSRVLKSGEQDAEFYRRMWDTLVRGEVWAGHFVNRRKDGTRYEEEATISPVRDAAGTITNYVAVKRDVTREMELQTQLRQSQKMEAIGQLAGGVAHDFNNILTSLLMQTELVDLVEALPEEAKEGLRQIRADANRAADLTRQLLLFSRRQVMQLHNLDLNEVVKNLTKMLQRIIGEDVHLQIQLHPEPLMTRADAGMLDQVLMNLVVNARDAMPGGGQLRIQTTASVLAEKAAFPEAIPGRYVCLHVSDTGGGIAPEVLPRIFEPFFTTKEAGKGTGLGLATVFGIVKQHRGWIQVNNQPGQGVTFQVFLPVSGSDVKASTPAVPADKPRAGMETILLVEDEAGVRRQIRQILKRHGYQVLEASNGVEALARWSQHPSTVALVLTDLVMPGGLSGLELARRLQADQPGLKVVFTSGYSPEIAGREIHLRSGENFIAKPFAPDQLLKTIRACLDS